MNNKQNTLGSIYGFDCLKFFMALMIIANHTGLYRDPICFAVFWPFIRCAVPVFFVLSSFFYFRKQNEQGYKWSNLSYYSKRLLSLYLFWGIVNLPLIVYFFSKNYTEDSYLLNCLGFVKNIIFYQVYEGSWFFVALLISIALITILKKCNFNELLIFIICFVFYCFTWWGSNIVCLSQVYEWYKTTLNDRIFLSFPVAMFWVYLGKFLSETNVIKYLNKIKFKTNYCILINGILLLVYVCFCFLKGSQSDYAWMNLLFAPLIVITAYTYSLKEKKLYKYLRIISVLLFMLQFPIIKVFAFFHFDNSVLLLYITTVVTCLIISTIIIKAEDKYPILKFSH